MSETGSEGLELGVSFLVCFLASLALTPAFRKLALRLNILDHPSDIKTHPSPVPYLGGAAIYAAFVAGIFLVSAVRQMPGGRMAPLLAGGSIVFVLGLVDDCRRLPFYFKLPFQAVAAAVLVAWGVRTTIHTLPLWLNIVVSMVWVIGITNAFNIIDIMDGLAGGVALISSLTFLVLSLISGDAFVVAVSAVLAGSVGGFLRYNYHRASIFMGDAGSAFTGFAMAAIAMGGSYTGINNAAIFVPVLVLGVPIFDTALVVILRACHNKSIFLASKDHLAIRLTAAGFSRLKSVGILHCVTLVLGIISIIVIQVELFPAVLLYAAVAILAVLAGLVVSKVKVD